MDTRTAIWIALSRAWTALGEFCIRVGRRCKERAEGRKGLCLSCLAAAALAALMVWWMIP